MSLVARRALLPVILHPPVEAAPGAAVARLPENSEALCQAGTYVMHQPIASAARLRLMGASVDPVTPDQVMAFIDRRAERGRKGVVANHNMHSLYLMRRDPQMNAFFQRADLIQIDSVPLIMWGQMLGQPIERGHRSTYLDWRDQFWSLADERGWRVFLLGSAPGVVESMIRRVHGSWPDVAICGHHGYFEHRQGSVENQGVLAKINAFRPDVVLVGMGMPIQEAWIVENEPQLVSGVLLSVGGAFDYEAGVQRPAPRWLGDMGLEWLFRFAVQPRRLFSRYFVEPWSLIGAAVKDVRIAASGRRTLRGPIKAPLSSPLEH